MMINKINENFGTKNNSVIQENPEIDLNEETIFDLDSQLCLEDSSITTIEECSNTTFWTNLLGKIREISEDDTRDGQISNVKQNATGDCWLLSGINSLSYTEKGKEVIEDALEYSEDGITVHLKGAGDYFVPNEVITQTKGLSEYSTGDDDMIAFELAIEKFRDQVHDNELAFSFDAPLRIQNMFSSDEYESDGPSIDSGTPDQLNYILTGKVGESTLDNSEKKEMLDKFSKNNLKDYALSAGTDTEVATKDINGTEIVFSKKHAYSIKDVTDKNVTVVNPWDSSIQMVLSRDTFLEVFDTVYGIDLSDENPEQNYIAEIDVNIENFADGTSEKTKIDKNTGKAIEKFVYDKNGTRTNIEKYNDNGDIVNNIELYENGYMKTNENYEFYDTGEVMIKRFSKYNPDGKRTEMHAEGYNKDGDIIKTKDNVYKDNKLIQSTNADYSNGEKISEDVIYYEE